MDPAGDRLERLARAVDAWLVRTDSRSPEAREAFLAQHEDLRDLLEPMLQEPEAEPEVDVEGRQLGDFRLIRELGRGGMGVVYEARQVSLDRRVALKVLPQDLTLRAGSVARFKREALTAGRLRHPGIVEVYAVGNEGETHFFAMELIEGSSLVEWIESRRSASGDEDPARRRRLQIQTAVELVAQVADALEHAHRSGVVHRDVKPTNILVRSDGRAVLTDFGLAWEENLPSLTAPGGFAGTPHYVSPEQAQRKAGAVDHRTDIFSLGATLYELLTRRRPFDADSTAEILRRIAEEDPVDPRAFDVEVESDLAAVVLHALEKSKVRRYPTAAAFAADLRAFLEHRPVVARRPSTVGRVVRWARRAPLRAGLVVTLLLAVPSIAGLLGYLLAQAPVLEAGRERLVREEIERTLTEADLELGDGRPQAALTLLSRAFAQRPEDLDVLAGLVQCQGQMGHGEEALALLASDKLAQVPPEDLDWLRMLALAAAGHTADAAAWRGRLGAPRRAFHHYVCGLLALAEAGTLSATRPVGRALPHLRRAVLAAPVARSLYHFRWAATVARTRDPALAQDCVAALEALWPDSPYAAFWIGFVLGDTEPRRAVAYLRRAIAGGLDRASVRANLAAGLDRLGDATGARAEWQRALALDPDYLPAVAGLGGALLAGDDVAGSLPYLKHAVVLAPASAQHHNNLGSALERSRDVSGALAEYRRAVALDPDYGTPRFNLGTLLLAQRDFAGAAAELQQAVRLLPQQVPARANLGYVLMRLGRNDEALQEFLRALEIDPQATFVRTNLATAVRALGLPSARALVRGVTAERPQSTVGWQCLATLLLDDSDLDAPPDAALALAAATRAVELGGERDLDSIAVKAEALVALGRNPEALDLATRALEQSRTQSRPAATAEATLRRLIRQARSDGK